MKHQQSPLIQSSIPRSTSYEKGKYGRLFPWLPPQGPDDESMREKMKALADIMFRSKGAVNSQKPAGYTYFGQFIAHDMTFDTTSIKERQIDPEQINNFRTPALDLDSIYGGGPTSNPYLYVVNGFDFPTRFLLFEQECTTKEDEVRKFYDLPRLNNKIAVVADPRNDENLFVSQMHVAFLLLHNYFEKKVDKNIQGEARFLEAQRQLRWHYQYVIIHDYLSMVLDPEIVEKTMPVDSTGYPNLKYFDWRNEPFIPLEFSGAVFRFGHSQVRGTYKMKHLNERIQLFDKKPGEAPKIFVDWTDFFDLPPVNPLATVDQKLVPALFNIEDPLNAAQINLAYRNLIRGLQLQLPSGQAIGRAMGLGEKILDQDRLKQASVGPMDDPSRIKFPEYNEIEANPDLKEFLDNTPLWYYILVEAQILGTQHLGPVGSRIVAEVVIGMIQGDKTSYLNHDPNWMPDKIKNNPNSKFTMQDLLGMADIYKGALV